MEVVVCVCVQQAAAPLWDLEITFECPMLHFWALRRRFLLSYLVCCLLSAGVE